MNDKLARNRDEWLQSAIDQHEHLLLRYAQQFVPDLEQARDIVQDAFVKLYRQPTHERLVGKP